ncbi:MAG: hypothetical protein HY716_03740 [Planctomycetes bacterium]|nr:hypothetical protein [Planctomycetota bacterium]
MLRWCLTTYNLSLMATCFRSALALALILATSGSDHAELAAAVADHDHHLGLGHPAEGEGNHYHGDADDHHETPDSPCHHHDTHTCCPSGVTLALTIECSIEESWNAVRIRVPLLHTHHPPSVVDILHVPVV